VYFTGAPGPVERKKFDLLTEGTGEMNPRRRIQAPKGGADWPKVPRGARPSPQDWQWNYLRSENDGNEAKAPFSSILANPFWSYKKIGTLALSSLCLLPFSPLSDFAVRYIANPLARRR
jgi:hypothetical protein